MKKYSINFLLSLLLVFIATPLLALDATNINQAIRDKGANWVAGETSISKLTPEQIRRRIPQKRKKKIEQRKSLYPAKASKDRDHRSMPRKFDWRNVGGRSYVTSVRDQGQCGSCWAFSTTASLESRILITSNAPNTGLDLSEQALVSCDASNQGCNGGYLDSALAYLETTGIPREADAPYTSGETQADGACAVPMQQTTYRVVGFQDAATSVETIKRALVEYGPLITGFTVYTDFLYYESGVYSHVTGEEEGGHAVLIVGYDDGNQAWIVKNSWGPDWGEDGYFRIRAGTNDCDFEEEVFAINFAVVPGTSFVLSPPSADFGTLLLPDRPTESRSFTITNNGSVPLTNIFSTVTNPNYSVAPLNVSTLASAAEADIQVTYAAQPGKTSDTGELKVVSDGVERNSVLYAQINSRPAQPTNVSPRDGEDVHLPVTLYASDFVDDDGDTHEASQWIIKNSSGDIVYAGSFDASNKTSFAVPSGTLNVTGKYYWQVIYRDDRGAASTASDQTSFASVPQEKEGHCFIATAAFGSPMAGQVEILRQFRDVYLLTNSPGQQFVAWYYRQSPDVANYIKNKPQVKVAVRVALYPLIGFAFLLISGYLPVVMIGLMTGFLTFRCKAHIKGRCL